jgi:hypothetical protein
MVNGALGKPPDRDHRLGNFPNLVSGGVGEIRSLSAKGLELLAKLKLARLLHCQGVAGTVADLTDKGPLP